MPKLALPDIELFFEDDGEHGETPFLLIAGFASDSASWAPLLPALQGQRTIRPDNRTVGRTTPWDAPTDIRRNAEDCAALLDHLAVDQVHVVGHSMGGLIAMDLATRYADRVQSLTIASIAPMKVARNVALFDALIAIRRSNATPDTWLRAFYPWLFRSSTFDIPGAIDAALSIALAYPYAQSIDAMEHQLRALDGYDPGSVSIRCPVQALLGSDDLLIQEQKARQALAVIPGIHVHRIEDAAHAIHWDQPQQVARHILGFASAISV